MATTILDLDLANFPQTIDRPGSVDRALVLIRFKGHPIGQLMLPIRDGAVDEREIRDGLTDLLDANFWELWLADHLGLDPAPEGAGANPAASPVGVTPATVAVCTRDRTDDLRRCLDALMLIPDSRQEWLVIDNCPSSDGTRILVERYRRVRYVREPRPGLDIARNRALREARHEIVVFADDDSTPEPEWLERLIWNFYDPRVACATGLVLPLELQTDAQEWFERLSTFNRGFRRRVLKGSEIHPLTGAAQAGVGASMALRRSTVLELGGFDEGLDAGTITRSGGDHEMFARILAAGHDIVYDPSAVSWHRHRRTWCELRDTLYGYGVGVYAMWIRYALAERDYTVPARAWLWFRHGQVPALIRSFLRRPNAPPPDLLLAELRGCAAAPWAYLTSRRRLRHGGAG